MSTPYVGFSHSTLASCPPLAEGESITCPKCKEQHTVVGSGAGSTKLLFYRCSKGLFLAGVAGRNVMGAKSDVSGEL